MNSIPLAMTELSGPAREDDDLVSLAQAGQVEAFERLYRENVGRVHAVCLRMTRDAAPAEDVSHVVESRSGLQAVKG